MATSGNIDRALTSWLTMRINWVVNSQDVATNKSNVTVKVQLITGNGNISSSASKAIKVSINGTTYDSTTTIGIAKNTTKTLYTKTLDIAHNNDGTKELALNCTLTFDATISGDWWSDRYLGGTASLNAIARASTFTRSGTATMGSAQTIKITEKNSSFTHTLKYTWGGSTTTIVSKTTATSYSWTPPVSMATKIPNASSGTCVLTCETYNGSTLIGSATLSFTLSVPASVVPTISAFTHSEAVSGLASKFGNYVDTKSKITYAVTAAGAQGSTIKSYSVSIAGQKFSTATGTTKEINVGLTDFGDDVGSLQVRATVTVTDSRGRSATYSETFKVLRYMPPTLTGFTVKRSTSAGVANDEGTALLTSYAAKIASVNSKNSGTVTIAYKKTTDSEYTTARTLSFTGTISENIVVSNITFSTDTMYHVKITVSDLVGTTITSVYEVPTAKPMLDFKANKKGVGIGKVATDDDLLDIGFKTRFYGGIKPMVIASGTDLNTLITPNRYASEYPANTTYYANCNLPANTGRNFTVDVEAVNDYNVKQTFTSIDGTTARTWERFKGAISGTSWGAWVCTSDLGGTLLWDSSTTTNKGYLMTASHTVTLSEAISKQRTGIVLVFSYYSSNVGQDTEFNLVFVPKKFPAINKGGGLTCTMSTANPFSYVASKYLYITDTTIKGNDYNDDTGTASGITYANNKFVLRYVIGV